MFGANFKSGYYGEKRPMAQRTPNSKCKLPDNYLTASNCGKKCVGETYLKVSLKWNNIKKIMRDEKWDLTWISIHMQSCDAEFDWKNLKTMKVEERKFDRKVREALEIQLQNTSPHSKNGLNQDDVTTRFWKPMFSYLRKKKIHWFLSSHSDVHFKCVVFQQINLYFAFLVF